MTIRVILRRKIMIQGKSQCSVVDIRLMQLTVFKVCFHLEVELDLWHHQRCSICRQERSVKLSLLIIIPSKALQLDVFPKDSLVDSETSLWVVVQINPCVLPSLFIGHKPMTSLPAWLFTQNRPDLRNPSASLPPETQRFGWTNWLGWWSMRQSVGLTLKLACFSVLVVWTERAQRYQRGWGAILEYSPQPKLRIVGKRALDRCDMPCMPSSREAILFLMWNIAEFIPTFAI